MRKKAMIIINPTAGKGASKNTLFAVVDGLCKNNWDGIVMVTQKGGDATSFIVERSGEFDMAICIGGDGTLNETVSGYMQCDKRIPLGYIPTGTVNDFATTLHLPHEGEKAIQQIMMGHTFACDIGSFNQRFFTYVAAFGAFTEVSYTTSQVAKNLVGRVAYFIEGVKHLPKMKTYQVRVEYDGKVIEDEFIFGAVSNSRFIGGIQSYSTKHAQLDDGRFECLFIRPPQNPLDLQAIAAALLKQDLNDKFMVFFKAHEVVVTSKEAIAWTLDGEHGGDTTHALIKNCPKAIELLVNQDEETL